MAGHNTVRVLGAGVGSLLAFCDVHHMCSPRVVSILGLARSRPVLLINVAFFSVICWAGPEICYSSRPYLKAKLGILTTACTPYYTAYDY